MKGILPVPRDIFHKRLGGVDKVTPAYIDAATPTSNKDLAADPLVLEMDAARNEWKARMAERRKQNLREGLLALQARRRKTDAQLAARAQRSQAERQRLIDAGEREDDRLTNPSVTALMQLGGGHKVLPDPHRAERVAEMSARVAAKEAGRADERQEALHALYTRAKDFIINEQQLDAHIDRVFGTATNPVVFGARGSSVWANGSPPNLRDLSKKANTMAGNDVSERTVNRMRRMAEELTGGKMS